mmetsp:Transcript_15367/g.50121  ORF Transcript_15367/g.50121 Transcript_15367/m.50121 type:complete len:213 (+) Transcript_15367:260-898(+)
MDRDRPPRAAQSLAMSPPPPRAPNATTSGSTRSTRSGGRAPAATPNATPKQAAEAAAVEQCRELPLGDGGLAALVAETNPFTPKCERGAVVLKVLAEYLNGLKEVAVRRPRAEPAKKRPGGRFGGTEPRSRRAPFDNLTNSLAGADAAPTSVRVVDGVLRRPPRYVADRTQARKFLREDARAVLEHRFDRPDALPDHRGARSDAPPRLVRVR